MPDAPQERTTSQGQDAYARLLDDIRQRKLVPGARMLESEIAARLGISRTPVREAIRQMEADGLVVHIPRSGARIRTLEYSEVNELYEMRAVLEGTAARLSARAASEVELAELDAINTEMKDALDDMERLYRLNRQFHDALLNAARNRYLSKSLEGLKKTLLILGPSTMEEGERASLAVAEHADMIDALRARDGAGAEAAMRRHIDAAHQVRLRQLRARPS
ncbi:GntR family transcriptional regulator [Tropicimonas sp. S265A]|uniref:GntR family transcriptional regulator n=1 Tax=Tropicimonas sp. S265A TaxID=3415134 RepID=UPI003C7D82F8